MISNLTKKDTAEKICIFLIFLIFVSKISFKSLKILPFSIGPIIYQHGMHPYINIGLQLICFLYLFIYWMNNKSTYPLNIYYRLFIYLIAGLLTVQTFTQMILINTEYALIPQISGLIMALILIYLYAIIIPSLLSIDQFIKYAKKSSVFLVLISLLFLPFFFNSMFLGGRFIGFFKHIPHMVSASTLAFIFYTPSLFSSKNNRIKDHTIIKLIIYIVLLLAVFLTSTKAAIISTLITIVFGLFIFGNKKRNTRLFKFTFLCSLISLILFCGIPLIKIGSDISTGKVSFGLRPAQNGIETRWEEVTRGLAIFEKSPYFGKGLMYKYLNNENSTLEVDGYNSFKDPHNLFISSGVIGGYPLMIISMFAYLFMLYYSLKALKHSNESKRIIGLFLLAHLPVFLIYHAHFSLGGIADRVYWLIFGFMAQSSYCRGSTPLMSYRLASAPK